MMATCLTMNVAFAAEPLAFNALEGWARDDHAQALVAFSATCSPGARKATLRPPPPAHADLRDALKTRLQVLCTQLEKRPVPKDKARQFFEDNFQPVRINGENGGFFTGYFEPVVSGSRTPTVRYTTPLRAPPPGLVPDPPRPVLPPRAQIQAGILDSQAKPLVWLDPVDAFFIHIQGSARIRYDDGTEERLAFAGRNGHPYTPIGRVLIERGAMTRENVTMTAIAAWLRDNPADAHAVMAENHSYIFFQPRHDLPLSSGPVGGAGVGLTPMRSLAIDTAHWPYGLPVHVRVVADVQNNDLNISQLFIAQDTGSAIVGPARADIFIGSGEAAVDRAGRLRHEGDFVVLWPRGVPYPEAVR